MSPPHHPLCSYQLYIISRMFGLSEDPMDAILDFMMGPKATVAGIHTLARCLQVKRNWEQVFLHPDNHFIHDIGSIPPPPPRSVEFPPMRCRPCNMLIPCPFCKDRELDV